MSAENLVAAMPMTSVSVLIVIINILLSHPLGVSCSKHHIRSLQANAEQQPQQPAFNPEAQKVAADEYAKWIASVRQSHDQRQAAMSTNDLNGVPGMAQPDLSVDFPGMKQYLNWESVVSPATYIVVDQNGFGNFWSVNDAINSIYPNRYRQYRITIQVNAGVYREKVVIDKTRPFITLQGIGQPTIVWNDTNFLSGNHTFDSATFGVAGNFFLARNITFQNTAPQPPPGAIGMQAVALRVTSDYAAFHQCTIIGNQDSLYDHNGRHYFKDCYIQGSIDFIFGDGLSIYNNCELNVVQTTWGAVTAQKRQNASDNTGFSFQNCVITGSGQVYLGRAWGPFSRVVYSYTWMSNVVFTLGWFDWAIPTREQRLFISQEEQHALKESIERNPLIPFQPYNRFTCSYGKVCVGVTHIGDWKPRSVYYGQYRCSGPGADETGRVAWSHELTDWEAAPFLSLSFVDGEAWVPQSLRPLT